MTLYNDDGNTADTYSLDMDVLNDLKEKAQERFNKGDFLSAFLIQSIGVEEAIRDRMVGLCVQNHGMEMKLIMHLTQKTDQKLTFYSLINNFSKVIPDDKGWEDVYQKAEKYRVMRNRVVHGMHQFESLGELDSFILEGWQLGGAIETFLCLN